MSKEERLSIPPGIFPRPQPWPMPWPSPGPYNPFPYLAEDRSAVTVRPMPHPLPPIPLDLELLKRVYAMPDYQALIRDYAPLLMKQFEQDPEAMKALQDLFKRHGASFEETERLAPLAMGLIIGGSFVIGGVLGYFAEGTTLKKK